MLKRSTLKRDPSILKNYLVVTDENVAIAKKELKILVPVRFKDIKLCVISKKISIFGYWFYYFEDKQSYAINKVFGMMTITPSSYTIITMDDVDHYAFNFEAGDIIMPNASFEKDKFLIYPVYKEFLENGKFPKFFDYEDRVTSFDRTKEFTGQHIGHFNILHLISSICCRDKKDPTLLFRQSGLPDAEILEGKESLIRPIGLIGATSGTDGTLPKLTGSYFSDNVTDAIVNPSEEVMPLEEILRL